MFICECVSEITLSALFANTLRPTLILTKAVNTWIIQCPHKLPEIWAKNMKYSFRIKEKETLIIIAWDHDQVVCGAWITRIWMLISPKSQIFIRICKFRFECRRTSVIRPQTNCQVHNFACAKIDWNYILTAWGRIHSNLMHVYSFNFCHFTLITLLFEIYIKFTLLSRWNSAHGDRNRGLRSKKQKGKSLIYAQKVGWTCFYETGRMLYSNFPITTKTRKTFYSLFSADFMREIIAMLTMPPIPPSPCITM